MLKNKRYRGYWLLFLVIAVLASIYPLFMGLDVVVQMVENGYVPIDDYPKYVIPYTPVSVAVIVGVLAIPLLQKLFRKHDLLYGSIVSVAVFFLTERLMETKVLVQTQMLVPLESWQMSLCYVPPEQYQTRTWEAVDVLLGGYSPTFKIHFYLIAIVIIVTLLNCFYGFAKMVLTGKYGRKKALIIQTAASVAFLGMCIWACFTAFYRSGEITVSPLSAVLMIVFFILLGVTVGVFSGSFLLGRSRFFSLALPSMTAALVTTAMYIGEMFLLSGNLYRFGKGFFFDGLGGMVLAPVDLFVIAAAGLITLAICITVNRGVDPAEVQDEDEDDSE